jgi:pimeloyl-ACP methyl ester carboxylesterase
VSGYDEHFFTAPDGVRTYYRRYAASGGGGRLPVLCMHGLTRNSRDFAAIAPRIAETGREVIAIDTRGRGRSDRDPVAANYGYGTYVDDVEGLLAEAGWDRIVTVGTSMGGLMSMFLAARRPGLISAGVINDIGPELDPAGIGRIMGYVGGAPAFAGWDEAAAAVRATNAVAFPNETGDALWLDIARRGARETPDGENRILIYGRKTVVFLTAGFLIEENWARLEVISGRAARARAARGTRIRLARP